MYQNIIIVGGRKIKKNGMSLQTKRAAAGLPAPHQQGYRSHLSLCPRQGAAAMSEEGRSSVAEETDKLEVHLFSQF